MYIINQLFTTSKVGSNNITIIYTRQLIKTIQINCSNNFHLLTGTSDFCESTVLNCPFINFLFIVLNNNRPCSELRNFLHVYSMKIKYIFTFILVNNLFSYQDSKHSSKSQLRITKYHNEVKKWVFHSFKMLFMFNILSAFNTIMSLKHGFGFPYAKPFTTFRNNSY